MKKILVRLLCSVSLMIAASDHPHLHDGNLFEIISDNREELPRTWSEQIDTLLRVTRYERKGSLRQYREARSLAQQEIKDFWTKEVLAALESKNDLAIRFVELRLRDAIEAKNPYHSVVS